MEHFSEKFGKLAEAMCKVQGAMRPALANRENSHRGSRYADLGSVMSTVQTLLSENGLFLTQPYHLGDDGMVYLTTRLIHAESEQWVQSRHPIAASMNNPQLFGSALTYARRYMAVSMLGVVTGDDDDDGQAASAPQARRVAADKPSGRGAQYRRQPQPGDTFDPPATLADELTDKIRRATDKPALQKVAMEIRKIVHEDKEAINKAEHEQLLKDYEYKLKHITKQSRAEATRNGVTITEQQGVTVQSDDLGYDKMSKEVQESVQQ